jgi:hypothetical protein
MFFFCPTFLGFFEFFQKSTHFFAKAWKNPLLKAQKSARAPLVHLGRNKNNRASPRNWPGKGTLGFIWGPTVDLPRGRAKPDKQRALTRGSGGPVWGVGGAKTHFSQLSPRKKNILAKQMLQLHWCANDVSSCIGSENFHFFFA